MGLQAVEQSETIHTAKIVEDTCICSSLVVQGNRVNVCSYHRCPVHNDAMEHDCTHNNIVTGQSNFVKFDKLPETISTPEPVEDACICSMLHIQGSSVHKHYNRCPVHNDTEEHNYTRRNTVMGRWLVWINNNLHETIKTHDTVWTSVRFCFLLILMRCTYKYHVICTFFIR